MRGMTGFLGLFAATAARGTKNTREELHSAVHHATGRLGEHIERTVGSVKEELTGGVTLVGGVLAGDLGEVKARITDLICAIRVLTAQQEGLVTREEVISVQNDIRRQVADVKCLAERLITKSENLITSERLAAILHDQFVVEMTPQGVELLVEEVVRKREPSAEAPAQVQA